MALLIQKHNVILNLPAIYRDLRWDAATCRDNLENNLIRASDANSKNYRVDRMYKNGETLCDGYLLVYSFETESEASVFKTKCFEHGFDDGIHIRSEQCGWVRLIEIHGADAEGKDIVMNAAEHVDASELVLCVTRPMMGLLRKFAVSSINYKQIVVSDEYKAWSNLTDFQKVALAVKSLIKTKCKHTNFYTPAKTILKTDVIEEMQVSEQSLPGILMSVQEVEHDLARGLDVRPEYFRELAL